MNMGMNPAIICRYDMRKCQHKSVDTYKIVLPICLQYGEI